MLTATDNAQERVNVICMKWGTLYGPHYVNRLASMVRRHLHRPHRFMCFTDDAAGLDEGIETAPLPAVPVDPAQPTSAWPKVGLFQPSLGGLSGPTLFLDLDVVIVDSIDMFFDHGPGAFCIIHNWTHPKRIVGNSSVFRFEPGAYSHVLDRYQSRPNQHWVERYRNEQAFVSHSIPALTYWPAPWCVSFKKHCLPRGLRRWFETPKLPSGARIVVFHGAPNPDDALAGRWPERAGWKRLYKRLQPAPWIAEHWR